MTGYRQVQLSDRYNIPCIRMRLTDLSYRAGFLFVTISYLKYRHLTAKSDEVKIVKFEII